jgi:hypothetical protein
MMGMRSLVAILLGAVCAVAQNATQTNLYENNFERAELQKLPEDMMLMGGGFAVGEEGGNKFLELPGAPLETFGVLFGPTETNGISVAARVFGTSKGRRAPSFAIGLNGVGGYKLQVSPAKKLIELYRGEELLSSAPYQWESGSWTMLRLQSGLTRSGEFSVEGKVWKQGTAEPGAWTISHLDKDEPPAGRSSLWGAPYSDTPIRFDDLKVVAIRINS